MIDAVVGSAEERALVPGVNDVVGLIRKEAGAIPQVELEYDDTRRLLWITMRPEPKPVLTPTLLDSLAAVLHGIGTVWSDAPDRPVLFVGLRSFGQMFSLGSDLDFVLDCLAENNGRALARYARALADVLTLCRNGLNGTAITFAAVGSRAVGSGVDLARSCHFTVVEDGASFLYPEVAYNQQSLAAVPVLARHLKVADVGRVVLSGREYPADELQQLGAADAVVPAGEAEGWIRREAAAAMASHAARLGVISACNRKCSDLARELAARIDPWVEHILTLKPLEIARLQQVTSAQENLLGRLLRTEAPPASEVRLAPPTPTVELAVAAGS